MKAIKKGKINIGDKIEIRPGRNTKKGLEPIKTNVTTLHSGISRKEIQPGGLVALGTSLDPSITKSDSLLGNVIGKPGTLPPVWERFNVKATLLERVVGTKNVKDMEAIALGVKNLNLKHIKLTESISDMLFFFRDQLEVKQLQIKLENLLEEDDLVIAEPTSLSHQVLSNILIAILKLPLASSILFLDNNSCPLVWYALALYNADLLLSSEI